MKKLHQDDTLKIFSQVDFSATPYDVTGSGQNRTKHYFHHIVVDFDLRTAIHKGLVKTIALDKRKELATMELDFRAVREGMKAIALSDGQRTMLRAGLSKLRLLEKHFVELTKDKNGISAKHPKMFVNCEDTEVTPLVVNFLINDEGLSEDDVMQIDSDKKGAIPENFGRVYAAYGEVFVVMSMLWGWKIDGKVPDTYDVIGAAVGIIGIAVIMYAPRHSL